MPRLAQYQKTIYKSIESVDDSNKYLLQSCSCETDCNYEPAMRAILLFIRIIVVLFLKTGAGTEFSYDARVKLKTLVR